LTEAAWAATYIGTLQATYTDFPYLGRVSEEIARRDALLGIGMTGMMDSPTITLDPWIQKKVATSILQWNEAFAATLGIRPAARTTCVKPSGTTSLELGCVGSGIHPHHAKRYIRRVTADELEVVFQHFRATNPHMCVRKPDGKWVIEFPVVAPEGAILKKDRTALEFLTLVRSTQEHWVLPGTRDAGSGLAHNVSNTVTVHPDEWEAVADFLWKNRARFTGVSLLPASGDKDYAFAPNEEVITEDEARRFHDLVTQYRPVDYLTLIEIDDKTDHAGEVACIGGACAV
jgi:ribonucleoside-diphosphate reductase alpha chain